MPYPTAITRLQNALDDLEANIRNDFRAKGTASPQDRRTLKNEIEVAMQRLDELRGLLVR
jgi:hypothetical protein